MDYSISIDKVVNIYATLSSDSDSQKSRVFCRTSIGVLESWLDKQKVTAQRDYEICYAAAAMANYRRALKSGAETVDFKAGDVSVTSNSAKSVEFAERLYNDAINAISDCLKNRRFAFMSIKG